MQKGIRGKVYLAALLHGDIGDPEDGKFDSILGTGDGDEVRLLVGLGDGDLGGGVGFQLLEPLASLAQNETVVLFRDGEGLARLSLGGKCQF